MTATAVSVSGSLAAPLTFKGGSFPGTNGTCTNSLAGGSSCTVVFTYAPTSAGGTSRTLTLLYNNGSADIAGGELVIAGTALGGSGSAHVTQVAAWSENACALYSNGTVACWGDDATQTAHTSAALVPGITTATALSVQNYACVVLAGGSVQCWSHWDGSDLTTISGISSAVAVNASNGCALLTGGTVSCFYDSDGNITAASSLLSGVTSLGTGNPALTGCVVASGNIECWGPTDSNQYGQLGLGSADGSAHATPTASSLSLGTVTQVASGVAHTCTLNSSGQVYCFGQNDYGQLGATLSDSSLASATLAFTGASQIVAGSSTSCVLASGGVSCWGYDPITNSGSDTPALISGTSSITQVSAGDQHVCGLAGSDVICWGENYFGQLGDGSTNDSSTPVVVQGL
jgi:hypothetical protein